MKDVTVVTRFGVTKSGFYDNGLRYEKIRQRAFLLVEEGGIRMKLYLIRHGRQDSTLCNVDVTLAEEGREQARLLGQRLQAYPIDAIYSSNLLRARETAEIIGAELKKSRPDLAWKVQVREGIREIEYGELQGIENKEVKIKYRSFFEERDRLEADLPFPGGECGQEVYARTKAVIDEIVQSKEEHVVLVMHGGTIRSILCGLLGLGQQKKLLFAKDLENCSITELLYDRGKQRFYLERLNDYAHLEQTPRLLRRNW